MRWGFPVHKQLEKAFSGADDIVFFGLQTVWEGTHVNTPENGPKVAARFSDVPTGYDAHVDGARLSVLMARYGTGGTPWTIVIDKKGIVAINEVTPKTPDSLIARIQRLRQESTK